MASGTDGRPLSKLLYQGSPLRTVYRPGLGNLPSPSDTYVLYAFCGAERYFLLARS